MDGVCALEFKIASEPWEFEQIHRLNYRTFVEEIPQHQANEQGMLVDKFHDQNTYAICLQGRQLVGMIALRDQRPFSLDHKLPNLDSYLPADCKKLAEIRLLAVEKEARGTRIFLGLMAASASHLHKTGHDAVVISGTTRQLKLYKHMGCVPFGPLIGTPGAMYQPMYLTRENFITSARELLPWLGRSDSFDTISFLPGPVDLTPEVRQAFASEPISHRAGKFLEDFEQTRRALCDLVNAADVQILTGSGTLANDVVAAQLKLHPGRGVVLCNGEFGERLVDHARRMGLEFAIHRRPWGSPFEMHAIEQAIEAEPATRWIWGVHSETSTGILNDIASLRKLAQAHNLHLCLDCISSIGTVDVDLNGVYLASGISGKGLRGYPGLALVFHNHPIAPAPHSLPRYLDLGFYAQKDGVPFTICSNLLYALKTAVSQISPQTRFPAIEEHSRYIRQRLEEMGLPILADAAHSSPAVFTIPLPRQISALRVGDRLRDAGFLVSYRSDYLLERNWVQVCLMGQYTRQTIDAMLSELQRHTARRAPSTSTELETVS